MQPTTTTSNSAPSGSTHADQALIFVHIPKTAGRTFIDIIARHYDPQALYFATEGEPSLRALKKLPDEQKQQLKFVYGHIKYGAHKLLPQPASYVSLVRDPVERMLSHYYFILSRPQHFRHSLAKSAHNLRDYIACGLNKRLDNGQTRNISGIGSSVKFGDCSTEHLELAKKNLREQYLMVGATERFDESILLLSKLMEWPTPYYLRLNVNQSRSRKESISHKELEVVYQYNQLDIELYEYANELLDERVRAFGLTFQTELEAFQRINLEKSQAAIQAENRKPSAVPAVTDVAPTELEHIKAQLARTQALLEEEQEKVRQLEIQQRQAHQILGKAMKKLADIRTSRFWQVWNRWQALEAVVTFKKPAKKKKK